jgi:hypothetical protein
VRGEGEGWGEGVRVRGCVAVRRGLPRQQTRVICTCLCTILHYFFLCIFIVVNGIQKRKQRKKNQSCHVIRHGVHRSPGLSRDMLGWGMSWDSRME